MFVVRAGPLENVVEEFVLYVYTLEEKERKKKQKQQRKKHKEEKKNERNVVMI
jgi:hypothetical protein